MPSNRPKRNARRPMSRVPRGVTMSSQEVTVTVPFKFFQTCGAAATTAINLSPGNFGGSLGGILQNFELFRFLNLQIQISVITLSVTTDLAVVGYFKTIPSVPPTTAANTFAASASRLIASTNTVPVRMSLTQRDLKNGSRVWYNTIAPTGVSADDLNQGILYVTCPTGQSLALEFSGMIQFRGHTNTNVD